MDEKKEIHNIIMENRNKITVSGVNDVEAFDERAVTLDTIMGGLIIEGENLHVNQLNVMTGELMVEGEVSAINYTELSNKNKGSILSKLFK